VKFDSDVGSVMMFGEIAQTLLKMMGHSGAVPSALLAEDIPAALERLKSALALTPGGQAGQSDHRAGERKVSLQQRAYPLIELMERAAQRKTDITWK
jgi:hypothetical protein